MANLDAEFSPQIFRKDFPMILATNRHLATLLPVRLAYDSAGYLAGQCLARRTDGLFVKYANGGASGTGTAAGFLFAPVDVSEFPSTTGTAVERGVFTGQLFSSLLIGNDSAADTTLSARKITDATGVVIYSF